MSASTPATAPVLTLVNGVPTTTSLDVAAFFGKRHDAVLRDIRNVAAQEERHANPVGEVVDGVGGDVEVLRAASQIEVANAAAHQEGLVTGLEQSAHDLHRVGVDVAEDLLDSRWLATAHSLADPLYHKRGGKRKT